MFNYRRILLSLLALVTSSIGNLNQPSELNVFSHLGNLQYTYISMGVYTFQGRERWEEGGKTHLKRGYHEKCVSII
jgi:hypothetical protein